MILLLLLLLLLLLRLQEPGSEASAVADRGAEMLGAAAAATLTSADISGQDASTPALPRHLQVPVCFMMHQLLHTVSSASRISSFYKPPRATS